MRRLGVQAAEHAADLGQLVHQLALVLKAPGGVDDQHVDAGRGRLLHRLIDDARRVAAFLARYDRHADPLGPGGELADRGGAEGVARRQHDAVILLHEQMGQLGDGRRLARAVDADDQDHLRPGKGVDLQRGGDLGQRLLHLLGDDQANAQVFHVPLEAAFRQARADMTGGFGAEVGSDQRFLDLVERILV